MGIGRIATLGSLSLALILSGCDNGSSEIRKERPVSVREIQDMAMQIHHPYLEGKGFVYSFNYNEIPVEVNISKDQFNERGNLLKYSFGNTSVRVYEHNIVKVYSSQGILIKDKEIIERAKRITPQIIKQLRNEQRTEVERANSNAVSDLNRVLKDRKG